jgi:DNA polymerase-3 subunit gamma/tau
MADDTPGEMHGEPGFLDDIAPSQARPAPGGYKVLARKYRPKDFTDLIGQDAMVRTISNAFTSGRIPQAWMLTGVRGVGKTTTARILARGLNFQTADGEGQPTIDLGTPGLHCQAIIEGRHIDVMEIDAASNNSVDNVRQINDAVRYAPTSARYKVYIVDEVHMLSGGAFNAFLKTLEEPPPHAKFIFATTEIRKVPVTILSRCQRFDLRRIDSGMLVAHLARICAAEGVAADDDAMQALARAAEGSARDSLSLLDQAIAHAAGRITLDDVRAMLGLADRARIIDLFEMVMRGDLPAALSELKAQHDGGADPVTLLNELAEFTHLVTRLKVVPGADADATLTQAERVRGADFAGRLSLRVLSRAWQMLLKGVAEVKEAGRPLAAAEMLIVRLAHAADLPTPDDALRALQNGGAAGAGAGSTPGPRAHAGGGDGPGAAVAGVMTAGAGRPVLASVSAAPLPGPQAAIAPEAAPRPVTTVGTLEEIVALAARNRDIKLQAAIQRDVRPVRIEPGRFEFALASSGDRGLAQELARKLKDWTGQTWMVAIVNGEGGQTLRERQDAAERGRKDNAAANPAVQAIMAAFPGARIVDVRVRGNEPEAGADGAMDAGLAASLESGEGLADGGEDAYGDIDF